jgi:uncharacterized protein YozE (UPF0346 family)
MRLGAWILTQTDRIDAIGTLAQLAAGDPHFPKESDYQGLHNYLTAASVDPKYLDALELARTQFDRHEYEDE